MLKKIIGSIDPYKILKFDGSTDDKILAESLGIRIEYQMCDTYYVLPKSMGGGAIRL
jgi:hypothetical protein